MTKKTIQITEKEAKIISAALSDYNKRLDGMRKPDCDRYFVGFECGQIDGLRTRGLRTRIEDLFEV